ncbi:hypothetical protein ACWC5F_26610 [Streptomyces sp. NPDC001272]|uniref:hypothetical protein n=1 Tax=unclassified Streptomyces TaxID=2593676 RepID=UPI0033B7B54C
MFPARIRAGAPLALVLLALSGCSSVWGCTDTTAERGEAGVSVQAEDTSGRPLGVTAAVVDWRLEPHPQVPAEGDKVHFHYRFDGAERTPGPALDVCAVDRGRVALGCRTVSAFGARPAPAGAPADDEWLDVEHPEQVVGVLFIPNDQSHDRRTCEVDIKDGGGTHPPERAGRGDQL